MGLHATPESRLRYAAATIPSLAINWSRKGMASPADVFLTENSPAMALVGAAGLFAPMKLERLRWFQKTFAPRTGVGLASPRDRRCSRTTRRSSRPTSCRNRCSTLRIGSWKGRWAASPSGADFQAIVGALLELKGEAATLAWLKAMKVNAKPYRGNGVAMRAVNAGEVEGAIIYHYYFAGDQAKTGENSKNVALHYFRNNDPGAFVSISGAGVLASSKRPAQAQAFVKWIAGKGGQDVLRSGDSYEYAVGIGAQSHPKLEPLANLQAPKVAPDKLNSKKVTDLMTAAGLL